MKRKIVFFALLAGVFALTSCQKDYEMTFTEAGLLAGQWVVTVNGDSTSDWVLSTSNTNTNEAGKLLLTDGGGFWEFTVDVEANASSLTFGQSSAVINQWYSVQKVDPVIKPYDIEVIIKDGKVERDAITLPSGTKADKISFIIAFEDDATPFTEYHIVGYRISGFNEDASFVYTEK